MVAKDTAQQQAEEAEAKLAALRREYENLVSQLEKTQTDLQTASDQLMELHLKHQENDALRGHLEEEQVNKTIQNQTVKELEHQIEVLHERNSQLQQLAKQHEKTIAELKEKMRKTNDKQKQSETESKTLSERMNEALQENEMLKQELIGAADRIDNLKKNDERKTKTQAKVQALSLTDSEEVIREYQRTSRESEARLAMLNKENDELQNKVNELIKEKIHLSRELSKTRSSPFSSPQLKGQVDSHVLMDALARLHRATRGTA